MANPPLILIVDDSAIQCKIYAGALKAGGYRVLTGENGRQGVELALQHHPDLILMDIAMPEMDGLSATQELRAYPEMAQVPILALTATTDPDDLERAYQAGYNDAVNKSEDRALVLEKIRRWLS
jgi:CheY-like chemotaxis protein